MLTTAMILAAGRGERMRPLTDSTPKPLLKVNGKALLDYHLEKLAEAGFKRVVINHAWLGEQIVEHIEQGDYSALEVLFSAEDPVLETAGGIVKALPLLTEHGVQEFVVINGDVFTDFSIQQLPGSLSENLAHLVMVDNPPQHPNGDFGLVGRHLRLTDSNRLTYSGIGVYHAQMFAGLAPVRAPLAPLLISAIEKGQISAQHHRGLWSDVGTPERLMTLQKEGEHADMG